MEGDLSFEASLQKGGFCKIFSQNVFGKYSCMMFLSNIYFVNILKCFCHKSE